MKTLKAIAVSLLVLAFSGLVQAADQTFTTSKGIVVKKSIIVKPSGGMGAVGAGPVRTNGADECGLVPDSLACGGQDVWLQWSFEYSFGGYSAPVELKRQVIDGQSLCSILVEAWLALPGCTFINLPQGQSPFYDYLPPQGQEDFSATINEILADEKPLPRCIMVSAQSFLSDPYYQSAVAAFKNEYGVGPSSVASGSLVDVLYRNGDVIRFTMERTFSVSNGWDWTPRLPRLVGIQNPSPCQPST